MGASAKFRSALVSAAITVLAACGGGSVSPVGSPAFHQAMHGASSNLRNASDQDLLYVTDNSAVDVYTYPQGDLVQSLYGYGSGYATGACVDTAGNVYVNFSYGPTVEYAHGGTVPINYWSIYSSPEGCAVDPTTGNLAVANPEASSPSGGHGFIWVWDKASGNMHYYTRRNFKSPLWCGYDNAGNLFIEGYSSRAGKSHLALFELPRGGASLKNVAISVTGTASGAQYDGKYLTIGAGDAIYQLRIKGSNAKVVGTTTLSGSSYKWNAQTYFVVTRGSGQGRRVVSTLALIGFFKYPAGGDPTKTIEPAYDAYSTVVSFAQK